MSHLVYREISAAALDEIRPQWEKLNAHHAAMSPHFGCEIRERTFAARKAELFAKAGKLRVEIACARPNAECIAYCISTASANGIGEIDSLFVDEAFRGQGIGTELMRHALTWLDGLIVTKKTVSVLWENAEALAFYRRFGFHSRSVVLQSVDHENPTA